MLVDTNEYIFRAIHLKNQLDIKQMQRIHSRETEICRFITPFEIADIFKLEIIKLNKKTYNIAVQMVNSVRPAVNDLCIEWMPDAVKYIHNWDWRLNELDRFPIFTEQSNISQMTEIDDSKDFRKAQSGDGE